MTISEITANQLIASAIEKLIESYQKKADKERKKVETAFVTYKGVKYYSTRELMDAYACEVFSEATYDRLLERLNKERDGIDPSGMTESELIVMALKKYQFELAMELKEDKAQKEKQEQMANRISELLAEGYSIKEAKAIQGNEEMMRYE